MDFQADRLGIGGQVSLEMPSELRLPGPGALEDFYFFSLVFTPSYLNFHFLSLIPPSPLSVSLSFALPRTLFPCTFPNT